MKFLTYFFLIVIIAIGGYDTFFYITKFKPLNQRIEGLKRESRTLTQLITKLKKEAEDKQDKKTGYNYKKNIINDLSKISTEENFEIMQAKKGVQINLPCLRLFNPGEEELSSEGLLLLSKLGKILKNATNGEIKVEGYTDDTKIGGELLKKFPTNWELSAARAVNVVRHLQKDAEIEPERLSAAAYGEYRPILPNDTEEHRRKNRRIVIVLTAQMDETEIVDKPETEDKKKPVDKEAEAGEKKESGSK